MRKTVALLGNPNTGKSSLFNALCGMSARVGNYPGITVEKKVGNLLPTESGESIEIVDLPGTYSLAARSADEAVTIDVLCGLLPKESKPDAVVVIVDATNLERNLYLVSQVIEVGIPTLLVFNMWDRVVADKHKIDVPALSERLGVPILCATACDRKGTNEVKEAIVGLAQTTSAPQTSLPRDSFPAVFLDESKKLQALLSEKGHELPTLEVDRLIIDKDGHFQTKLRKNGVAELDEMLQAARERLEREGCKIPLFETKARYAWVRQKLLDLVERPPANRTTSSDRVDRWLTHRWVGMVVFLLLMFSVFQAITIFAKWPMDGIEFVQTWAQEQVEGWLSPGALRSLFNDGVIAGIGAVVMFLPQIAILFLFIAILEDCGYMARAAFVVDKLMSSIGLSGKSFLPLMSSFACAVPGIMATRTIENTRDRMVTILIAPLMSCSARLPVYVLMVTAFVPDTRFLGGWLTLQGIVLFAMHCLGATIAIPTAWFLRKFFFAGQQGTFLLELHSYKWPSWNVLYQRVWERVWAFVARAGTLIFCTAILVWAACYFPASHQELDKAQAKLEQLRSVEGDDNKLLIEDQLAIVNAAKAEMVNKSFLGMIGKVIEPAVKPLGWDWKIGVATIASFPAREVIIATLGTIYSLGSEENEESDGLKEKMKSETWPDGQPVFTLATAFSVMVFFALCAQCAATLMTIKRETNSWRWPIFSFVSMTTLAYVAAWITYSVASWLGLGG